MRLPKLKLWMFLVLVAVLAIVINRVIEVQRERQWVAAWKSAKLVKENYVAASKRHAEDARRWMEEAERKKEFAEMTRRRLEEFDDHLHTVGVSRQELRMRHKKMAELVDQQETSLDTDEVRAEWCRLMALRSANLKKKYELAAAHPEEVIASDPPYPPQPK